MSYCRFCDGDVYAYDSVEGGVRFYVADGRRDLDRLSETYHEAYQYAKALRDEHGLEVPSYAIESMRVDALEELVRDMWREGAFEPGACYVKEADRLVERTRELGIEVK